MSGSLMSDAQWCKGISILEERGLSFDQQASTPVLAQAVALANDILRFRMMMPRAGASRRAPPRPAGA